MGGTFLLVANITYGPPDKPFGPLAGTATEADWVKRLVPRLTGAPQVVEWRQEDARAARVLAELPAARLAHLATHAFFADHGREGSDRLSRASEFAVAANGIRLGAVARNPLAQAGLALAGANQKPGPAGGTSLISGEVLAGLDLSAGRLYVLPACHTATGEAVVGEGVYGFQRALHQAGVDDVIAGLWKVDDRVAPAAMLLFYHHLASGLPPLDALREAQLFLLRHPDAVEELWKKNAPLEVARLVASRPRGTDPEFVPFAAPTAPKNPVPVPGGKVAALRTRDWAVFILSGLGK